MIAWTSVTAMYYGCRARTRIRRRVMYQEWAIVVIGQPLALLVVGAAGVAEVDVVERGAGHGGRGDRDARAVEGREHGGQDGGAVVDAGAQLQPPQGHLSHATDAVQGKGRKQRITPLTPGTVAALRAWLAESGGQPGQPLFPTRTGGRLSHDAVEHRIAKHAATAAASCASIRSKKITAHTLRHTAAMRLPHAGTDTSVIALWLGHEQADTTQIYLHADLALKEQALARTKPPNARPGRYQPRDQLLAFLEAL